MIHVPSLNYVNSEMENNSGDENSDNGLQIVIESPRPKKKTRKELNEADKKIIESVEKDLEENLEEKATKANLTAKHVKNIIKEVVTNEHVLALVRHAENPDDNNEPVTLYEPKCTRAKTKQFLPWIPPTKPVSEVQRLFTEDLQEDSSGDEYVPEIPSKNCSFDSQLDTSKSTLKDNEEANIALRTRSKLCLSHTPLEVIEEAFMPPDITTDMYDMDCDDDVWTEFLKTFTRPLDEVTKAAEDEDHDPEYNVLADEEIDEVDREELRADRAVTVSRKEFNCLMTELFEFADIYESEKNAAHNSLISNEESQKEESVNTPDSDSESDPNISIRKYQIPILAQQMRQHVQMLTHNFLLSYEHPEYSDMAVKFKEMLIDIAVECEGKDTSIYRAINLQPAIKLIESWEKLFAGKGQEIEDYKRHVEKVIAESIEARRAGTQYIVTFPSLLMQTISNSEVFIYPNLLPRVPFKSLHLGSPYHNFTHGEDCLIALFLEQAIPYLKQDPFHLTKFNKINMQHVCHIINKLLMPNISPSKILVNIRKKKDPGSEENPIKFFYRNKKAPPAVHYVAPLDQQNMLPPCKRSPELLPNLWRDYIYPGKKSEVNNQCNNICTNQIIIVSYPVQRRPTSNSGVSTPYDINFSKKIVTNRKAIQSKGPLIVNDHVHKRKERITKIAKRKEINKKTKIVLRSQHTIKNILLSNMLPDMPSLGNTPIKNGGSQSGVSVNSMKDDAVANDGAATKEDHASTSKNDTETVSTAMASEAAVNEDKEQNLSFKNISDFSIQFRKPDVVNQVKRNFESISEFSMSNKDATAAPTEKDNPDDINELMKASSTVKNVTKKEPSGAEKKRAKLRREFVANLVMATPDSLETQNQKEDDFADAFFDKLRQTLTVDDYDKLIGILGHYDENKGDFLKLYQNVQSILYPTYQELSEEFMLFLTEIQAYKVGQLMPYFVMKDMDRFIKKLHIYFKDQPFQMKKIMKALTDLSENPDITMETIKTAVLPLFKGNAALTDWFLQIFPCERPPKILTTGPHEVMDLVKELARPPEEDICETVVLPDTEDPYGGPNCICPCHNVDNAQFKTKSLHCNKCGLKFIQGKMYIQTGKALRPAVVSFLTNPEKDHSKRLATTRRKRSDTSPSKQITSPNKENHTHEEVRQSHESEDDESKKKNPKQTKTQRKRTVKDGDKLKKPKASKAKSENPKTVKTSPKRQTKKKTNTKKTAEHKPGSTSGQLKRPAEEPEIEYTEPAEVVEFKVSSDHSGESQSEFFESSQDVTNTDSEDSHGSINLCSSQSENVNVTWTREEDKIILQAFRQSSDNEATFRHISEVLENRSIVEIKSRFHKLMNLLQKMTSSST